MNFEPSTYMNESNTGAIDRDIALDLFEQGRAEFTRVIGEVPDAALGYRPAGEDYSISDIITHVASNMRMYAGLLQRIEAAQFGEITAGPRIEGEEQPAGREAAMHDLQHAHGALSEIVKGLGPDNFSRQAPVHYSTPPAEPFPTGAADIIMWTTDHYNEHSAQVEALVKRWQTERGG